MSMLLINLLKQYWAQSIAVIAVLALMAYVGVQHVELNLDATKLKAAAMLHQADVQRIATLGNQLSDQNNAIAALQTAQARKEQTAEKALAVAKVQQQKVVTLLVPTDNKKPVSCEDAMPDVRAILKGLTQ